MQLSVDDACASDVRVAELARNYKVPTVFYWPVEWHSLARDKGWKPLPYSQAEAIALDFEIGSHTITHPLLTQIPLEYAEYEIEYSKYMIMDLFGGVPSSFCPPRGYMTPELMDIAKRHYDIIRLTKDKGLVHVHPDSGANGNRPWRDCITDNTVELWCHSWELDKFNLWDELEEVLREDSHT